MQDLHWSTSWVILNGITLVYNIVHLEPFWNSVQMILLLITKSFKNIKCSESRLSSDWLLVVLALYIKAVLFVLNVFMSLIYSAISEEEKSFMKQNLITSFHEPVSQVHYLLFAITEFALYYYVIVRTTVFIWVPKIIWHYFAFIGCSLPC